MRTVTMDDREVLKTGNAVRAALGAAGRTVVVVSDPIDPDCLGSALALVWWLTAQGNEAAAVSFFRIPDTLQTFPDVDTVAVADPLHFAFGLYELIVLVDGGSWQQFFGPRWQAVLGRLDIAKVISIDHHRPDDIAAAIPERCLRVITSSTAQVVYECILQPDGCGVPPRVADYLYQALLYDSRMFKNETHPGQYAFAQSLIDLGADHDRAADSSYDPREMEFFAWAVEHTEYLPDLGLTLLSLDTAAVGELQQRFGVDFSDYTRLYKETFQRQVLGYHYGVILRDNGDGTVSLNWRTRNYGNHLSLAEVARSAGFNAGGHRNAGGGSFNGSLEDARTRLIAELRSLLS